MVEPSSFPYLSSQTLEQLNITTQDVIESLESLIRGAVDQKVWHAPKSVILPSDGRYIMSTLSVSDDPNFLAVKSVVVNNKNSEKGLPAINGMIMLLDGQTGLPKAIVDGNWVTAVRTAAGSALAATRLARSDSSSIAFIGCGVQAHSHLKAFNDLFPLKTIFAVNPSAGKRDELCRVAVGMGLKAISCNSARESVEQADIVISAVSLSRDIKPFLDARWLKQGAFACSVDLGIPWMDEGMDTLDRVVVDDIEQEKSSDIPLVRSELISGDLTGLVTGVTVGRTNPVERTAFLSRAIALGDLALAGLAYKKACAVSAGQEMRG